VWFGHRQITDVASNVETSMNDKTNLEPDSRFEISWKGRFGSANEAKLAYDLISQKLAKNGLSIASSPRSLVRIEAILIGPDGRQGDYGLLLELLRWISDSKARLPQMNTRSLFLSSQISRVDRY
jgi:hypothetical protein